MSTSSIRGRLIMLVTFLAGALVVVGGIGIYNANRAESEIDSIFRHQTLPMRELARIRRLVVENSGQIFRAIQHNPTFEYAQLHQHPVDEHLNLIEKNVQWMDETFASMKGNLLPDSEEMRILGEFQPLYDRYVAEVLKPTMAAMRAGDYSSSLMARFLSENGNFEKQINPMLRSFAEAQQNAVQNSHTMLTASNERMRLISIILLAVGLLAGIGLSIHTIRSITGPLHQMQSLISRVARDKDFTGHIDVHSKDEVGVTAAAFNDLLSNLRQSLGQVRQGIVQVDDATLTLASAATQAARASNETSESASAMAASVEQMSVSISSVSEHTREALNIANVAGEHSETGGAVINSAVDAMAGIVVQVKSVGKTITELGEHSDHISSVVQVIKDVADQTNLLALNAAIEAARAGEQGRGFAVVADEVRKLAERTTNATVEIATMIGDIQNRSRSAVSAMEDTIGRIEAGSELATRAGQAIEAIRNANAEVQRVFADINEAMREQGAASYDIAQRVERVAQASEQSSVSVQVSSGQADNIRNLANGMRTSVEQFKV